MTNFIYDKTEKGRAEIATRQYRLAPRLRTMLLLFDGKNSSDQVLQKVTGLGLDAAGITELIEHGFIHEIAVAGASAAAVVVAPVAPVVAPSAAPEGQVASAPNEESLPDLSQAITLPLDSVADEMQTQFQSVYNFFNDTIKKTLGFRGFAMQMKVERASTVDDLRALRDPFVAAVLNAHGPTVAKDLADRLDILLKIRS
ncbi:MAG: hypothetical protein M3N23_05090 [Pseudomonadota bacterium]|nr:hypothetical protein [Pseudomonadota bacterium]